MIQQLDEITINNPKRPVITNDLIDLMDAILKNGSNIMKLKLSNLNLHDAILVE